MSIQRYHIDWDWEEINISDDGEYCEYTDVEPLEQRIEELEGFMRTKMCLKFFTSKEDEAELKRLLPKTQDNTDIPIPADKG